MHADPGLYLADPETVQEAVTELRQRGFTIEAQGVTLSISGPSELFERVCGVEILFEKTMEQEPGQAQSRTRLAYRSSRPVMQIKGLEGIIEGIVFTTQGVPFGL